MNAQNTTQRENSSSFNYFSLLRVLKKWTLKIELEWCDATSNWSWKRKPPKKSDDLKLIKTGFICGGEVMQQRYVMFTWKKSTLHFAKNSSNKSKISLICQWFLIIHVIFNLFYSGDIRKLVVVHSHVVVVMRCNDVSWKRKPTKKGHFLLQAK